MDEAIAMGTCRFQFGGSGEPLLHGDALDLIAHAKGAGCFCRVNTNGLLLNRSTADAMLDMGLDQISMTTLAGDEEAFRGTHAGCSAGTFGQLRENLIYLCGRKRELGLGRPKVNANCIVISANCDRLSDIARFCQTVGLDGLFFKPLDDVQDPGLARVAPTERQARRVRDELPGVAAYLDEHAMRHNVSSFLAVFNRRADTTEVYRHIPCYYGWLVALIDVDGQVYPCCRCYVAQGNAYETGLGDIWRSKAYALFRQEAARLRDRGKPLDGCVCNSCTNYAVNLRVFKALHPLRRLPRPLG
jgi:MoaA/NifB/PqqE/SkfB family radical SAM enzyme